MISSRAANKQQELERELKILNEALQQRETEIARKNEMLEKEKRNVYELERSQQNKLFEYDAMLQNEKANYKNKIEEHKTKIDEANVLVVKANSEKNEVLADLDRMKGLVLKNEYEFKLYQQEINNLKTELEDLRPSRDKYNELLKEYRIVSEHKVILEKNH
jgi:chromosome segregation ATPase